jgi:hypothetical protein
MRRKNEQRGRGRGGGGGGGSTPTFSGAMVKGFSGTNSPTNYFAGPSGDASFNLANNNTIACLFWWNGKPAAGLTYIADLLSNFATSPTFKGWNIQFNNSTLTIQAITLASGSTTIVNVGTPQLGLNALVVTGTATGLRASLNGATVATLAYTASPVAPDATCQLLVGAAYSGANGWDLGGVLAFAHLTRTASDTELQAWASYSGGIFNLAGTSSLPAAPASRYVLPAALTGDASCDVDWNASRDWNGSATTSTSHGSAAVTLTVTGALSLSPLSEQWIGGGSSPPLQALIIDTKPPILEGGYVRGSSLSRLLFAGTVDTTKQADILITADCTDSNAATNVLELFGVFVDGVLVTQQPSGTQFTGNVTCRYNLGAYNAAPTTHTVEIWAAPEISLPNGTYPPLGSFLVYLVTPPGQTFSSPTPNKRLVAGLDSIVNDFYIGLSGSGGVGARLRTHFPTSGGPGQTSIIGWGGYAIQDEVNGVGITGTTGNVAALAALIVSMCQKVAGGGAKYFYDDEGFNTYFRSLLSPAAWATVKGQLYDAIHAADSTITVVYSNFPQSFYNSTNNSYSTPYNLSALNTAAAGIVTGRSSFVKFVDLTSAGITFLDHIHPDGTASGATLWESTVRAGAGW